MNLFRVLKGVNLDAQLPEALVRLLLCELSKFVPNHVFCYPYIIVGLAVVDLKDHADKIREDSCASRLCPDWWLTLSRLNANNWEAVEISALAGLDKARMIVRPDSLRALNKVLTYGTIFGPNSGQYIVYKP